MRTRRSTAGTRPGLPSTTACESRCKASPRQFSSKKAKFFTFWPDEGSPPSAQALHEAARWDICIHTVHVWLSVSTPNIFSSGQTSGSGT